MAVGTNQLQVYSKSSDYVKQREEGWKDLESRHQSGRGSVYVSVLEGVANYASVCYGVKAERMCESYRGSREEAFTGTDSSLMFFLP